MVEPYTQFFPVRVEYTSDNDHIYVIDEADKLWKCWIASPADKRLFEDTNVRYFQAMYEFDGMKEHFTVLVDQPAEPFEYDEDD
jgi:hypothetical protein